MECYQFGGFVSNKIAAFDLDGTLIQTKSKRRFPKDKDDWQLVNDLIKPKLKKLYENNYCIIIFTNQKNLNKRMKLVEFQQKCANIQKELDIPMIFYVSLRNNYMRKPFPGMFYYHNKKFSSPVIVQISFYVGDAWSKTECFSDSDLCFAKNCRLPFYKAKEFFAMMEPQVYNITCPLLSKDINFVQNQIRLNTFILDKQYLFIVSPPASGKTTFCKKYLSDYIALSKDDYTTPARYRNIIQENLDNKIVFDNTNSTEIAREKILSYLKSTEKVGYIVRNVTKKEALYLNKYRHFISHGRDKLLPNVAIHTHFKRLVVPTGANVFTIDSTWISSLKDFYC